jgi:carboxylate-amine ligase
VFERRFGESTPWSVGIEEELFVLDARTLLPASAPDELFDGARRGRELFRSVVELRTPVCATVADAVRELAALRAQTAGLAQAAGLRLAATGTHPLAQAGRQQITNEPGLKRFAAYAGPSARIQYCCGLHVHVGVRSAEACMAALEAVLPWLPVVLALSANSPYFEGGATGLHSTRAELLTRLPRSGAPPVFASLDDWERFARRLVDLGLADDYTRIWWDIRPHPRYGTLEVRMPDQPTRLEVTAAFATLVQALVAAARPGPPADRGVFAQNRWAALRFGAAARLIDPEGERLAGAAELAETLVERVRPHAEELGSDALLEPLRSLARRSQADEQLELGQEAGLRALVERLVASTVPAGG